MRRTRRPRGFVLIAVLFIVLVLAVVVGAYLTQATQAGRAANGASAQQLALMHAEMAAQDAVRAVRGAQIVLSGLYPRTAPDSAADCANLNCISRVAPAGADTIDLREGGGQQWEWVIHKSDAAGAAANRYIVQATGFYGYTTTAANFTSARIEVEIDVGSGVGGQLGGSEYGGNSGGL